MRSFLLVFVLAVAAQAQPLDVTIRYVPAPDDPAVRAFAPGEFNGWGPNNAGAIPIGAPSQMTFVDSLGQYFYTIPLSEGARVQYKIHFHFNEAGTDWQWVTDPLNPDSNPADNNNSVLTVQDPMLFQPAAELNEAGLVDAVSVGLFASEEVTRFEFTINGEVRDGLPLYDPSTGVFRFELDQPVAAGAQFRVE
ncbi:MAG: hypothetical protein AAGI08_18720, partial [Bacteroidota bacterium]